MSKKTKEIDVIKEKGEQSTELDVAQFIEMAIEKNLPVESMERLFSLYEKVKREKAKQAYIKALGKFQSEIPIIKKTKKVFNKDGKTVRYMYAPLESEIEQIKEFVADNGFSYSWDTGQKENKMKVTCKLTHELGHSEESSFEIPIEKSQYMTHPQSYASAQTFAKRYTLNNVLGIATAEEDTDATDVEKEKSAKSLKSRIVFLLRALEYEANTKEEIEKVVKKKTNLTLEEKNYQEIVNKLEVIVKEQQEIDIIEE